MPKQLALDWTLDEAEARVLALLRVRRGRAQAIKVEDLATLVGAGGSGLGTGGRQVQDVVKRLREQHGVPICSAAGRPAGYYMAATADELEACYREHRSKALSTLKAMAAIKRVGLAELLGQLALEARA